ncbi:signal transduction histidine kinase [Rhodoblastus acidophilus]|uniref:sensor histidine kinase n=1 Tax=Rhodoblastus acidophilus TaxID=1074 RepID=UPI00222518BF|nr:PAS domain-containing sensor histidine kinase [Rhodoblastus acidophilus]MCW2284731.1 signal transduction histidine kinase [Rhodoblastus acidophilus]MCW2333684.1 signal transduction histidine kinase [Rhodoblastus acidophilus]
MDGRATEGLRAEIAAALADTGVASLDRAGAPVLVAEGEGLRLVHANPAALALFGAESLADFAGRVFAPAASALAPRLLGFAPGAGRIERVGFGPGAPTLTFLCRRAETGALFVLAGLGPRLRGAVAPKLAIAARPVAAAEGCAELKRDFERRYPGLKPARFLWRTDARNVVTEVTPPLAEIFGGVATNLVGRELAEVARGLGMDPDGRLATALTGRATFSGVELIWPIDGAAAAAPVSLGALPAFDRETGFDGWRGFGVIQLDRLRERALPPVLPEVAAPEAPAPEAPDTSGVVLPFPPARGGAPVESRDEPAALVTLAPHERQAFREIARTLGAHGEPAEAATSEPDDRAVAADAPADIPAEAALFDEWPVGLAIRQAGAWVRANRALLDWLGCADEAEFRRTGSLRRDLFARGVAVHIDTAPTIWRGAPAEAVVVSRIAGADAPAQAGHLAEKVAALQASLRQRETEAADVAAILAASADGVVLFNADGDLLGLNAAAETFFGRARDESLNIRDLVAPEGQAAIAAALGRLAAGEAAPTLRLSCAPRSGAALTLATSFARMSGGKKFCAVFRDLAPAGEGGPALRDAKGRAEARAEAAEAESRAKTEYLAAVTHEIRTPLNAILGFTEVIMDERFGPVGNARYKEYLKDIHASGAHVMSLVNDLLDLSKIEAGKLDLTFAAVDANQVVAECVSLIQPQANRERVITRLALASGLPAALADERSLRQIVLNLLANAVRYNEPGGQVIVSTSLVSTGAGGRVLLRVKDTGIGMSESELETALEPFRQVSSKAGGSGLGLPLTKALAEANHAEFAIRSRKNEGTLVEVSFALAPAVADGLRSVEQASR